MAPESSARSAVPEAERFPDPSLPFVEHSGRGRIVFGSRPLGATDGSTLQAAVKRSIDVVLAAVILLLALPLLLVISLAIVVESPGPILYRADRLSRGGRSMRMLKFRKMHPGAQGPRLTLGDDTRLTRLGRV